MTLLFVLLFSVHFLITAIFPLIFGLLLISYAVVRRILMFHFVARANWESILQDLCRCIFRKSCASNHVEHVSNTIPEIHFQIKVDNNIVCRSPLFSKVAYLNFFRGFFFSRFCLDFKILIAKLVQRSKKEKEKKYDQQITRSYSCKG